MKLKEALEAMAKVTSMRGAQSYGYALSTPRRMGLYKAVVPKRVDVSKSFRKSLRERSERPLAVAGHLRFATSSTTTRRDAHPHVWLSRQKVTVLTVNPLTLVFKKHRVSRATVVTHNGDFEAFDMACFGSSKVWSLEQTRHWLATQLGTPAPSDGDSIVAAGLIELLFAMGDPFASARLAVASMMDDSSTKLVPRIAEATTRVLMRLNPSVVSELAHSLSGNLEVRQRRVNRLATAVAEELSLVLQEKDSSWIATVARETTRNFIEADLRSATRKFLKYAHGSFGLVVMSSLAPTTLVIASVKQPMQVGVGPGFLAYASERAALHVGEVGRHLRARRILKEGEVLWIAPSAGFLQENYAQLSDDIRCRVATASILDDRPFRHLRLSSQGSLSGTPLNDFDLVDGNKYMMPFVDLFHGDVVAKELQKTPGVLQKIRDSFRDPASPNSSTARALAAELLSGQDRLLDLLVVGMEASLWVGEQWAANLRSVFPKLRVRALSANKVLASLTAVAHDATCGAQTPGFSAFPSGCTPAEAARGSVVLVLSHSGQTFPSLNAARALKKVGASVFAVAGLQDTVIASDVLDQSFAVEASHSNRLFSTDAGILIAEAASCSTCALHVLLTEILFALGRQSLLPTDFADLRSLADASIDRHLPLILGQSEDLDSSKYVVSPTTTVHVDNQIWSSAVALGRRWGNHIAEPFVCFLLATAYVLATVTAGTPLFRSVVAAFISQKQWWYILAAADALLYAFFPVACALTLRLLQGRTLLARFGKRNILVLDVPQVSQCVAAYAQKLFALSYGFNSVDITQANPGDHAVHKVLHKTVRGTLVALGVPDGRLKALVDAECAAFLTASQIKSISHWGTGAELITVGHHSFVPSIVDEAVIYDAFSRPAFHSELVHLDDDSDKRPVSSSSKKDAVFKNATTPADSRRIAFLSKDADGTRSHTIVETLYEGRVASLERQLGFYVLFHAVAKRASDTMWPLFHFDLARSQAGTRVATTPAPISPAVTDPQLPRVLAGVEIQRVTTLDDFHHVVPRIGSAPGNLANLHWRTLDYDTLSIHTDEASNQGLDLSAYDEPSLYAATNLFSSPLPDPIPDIEPDIEAAA